MNGTTIRHIAERGGISEGVIYRHFESKDQLFFEAVVEPLREAVDKLAVAAETVDRDKPLTPERQRETLNGLYRQLLSMMEEVLPAIVGDRVFVGTGTSSTDLCTKGSPTAAPAALCSTAASAAPAASTRSSWRSRPETTGCRDLPKDPVAPHPYESRSRQEVTSDAAEPLLGSGG